MNTKDLLVLALAIYPDRPWRQDSDGTVFETSRIYVFDPANNSEQFVEVLAWLLRRDAAYMYSELTKEYVWVADIDLEVDHDGTAADIRRAVVEAALRVANA